MRVIRYGGHQLADQVELLQEAAADPEGRVRLEALIAASWLEQEKGLSVLEVVKQHPLDKWMEQAYETAFAHLQGYSVQDKKEQQMLTHLKGSERDMFVKGKEIYSREGYCITCHQPDGKGLDPSGFPTLSGTKWVTGSEERLIKLTLKGLMGPIEVNDKKYGGQVPMTPFGGLLNDQEVAAVLTYVRNAFGK